MNFYPWLETPHWFGGLSRNAWRLILGVVLLCAAVSPLSGFPEKKVCHPREETTHVECYTGHVVAAYLYRVWWFAGDNEKAILAIFTVGLTLFTARLFQATKILAADARDSAKRQSRAYVELTTENRLPYQVTRANGRVTIEGRENLINSGQTPAHHVWSGGNIEVREYPLRPFPIPWAAHDRTVLPSYGVLGAGQKREVGLQTAVPIPERFFNNIPNDRAIYMFGRTTYRDVFGRNHWTTFCQQLIVENDVVKTGLLTEYNNEMDEDK